MTWNEMYTIARKNYCRGGDFIVECWDERTLQEYEKEFGPMTVKTLYQMMNLYEEVEKDIQNM